MIIGEAPMSTNTQAPAPGKWKRRLGYFLTIALTAGATFGLLLLWQNIAQRKQEAQQVVFPIVALSDEVVDPEEWGKNYPRQYDGYRRTADNEYTHRGPSEALPQKLDIYPSLPIVYDGYAFSVDFRVPRGHAYMLHDQEQTERVKKFKQSGACLHCHASMVKTYRDEGKKAGAPDEPFEAALFKGFEVICPQPYAEARKLASHPVACVDCHDPKSMQLRVSRPGFLDGIRALARSDAGVPHLPSIQAWRKGTKQKEYDPNHDATRQELRSMVCGQCHVEYYFKGPQKLVTYPWQKGLLVEQIEAYYDETGFKDWTHPRTGTEVLKAQHPEFEMWSQGIHARNGVACADCHMPYRREGAVKISDHQVRSPLLSIAASCQVCHRAPEGELRDRVETIQNRTRGLVRRNEAAMLDLIAALEAAQKSGAAADKLQTARALHRKAQWRFDFVLSENSLGFHAPQESARILGEALDYARQGQLEALKATQAR
jgi:nitrite reductase (cytochrome c-552)